MNFEFYEGAAGTGKTHNIVGRASEIVQNGALIGEQKLLALTFMNGSRRRLDLRLGQNLTFRRRYNCQTFDVFARMLIRRRSSLITQAMNKLTDSLNEFDGPCALAALLLEQEAVRLWVARSYPLILVDEVQDLDEHRLRILKGLSRSCRILAAADAFQCLNNEHDTTSLIQWLESVGQTTRLTIVHRTNKNGLLSAARAIREGKDVKSVLRSRTSQKNNIMWYGDGFRLQETVATAQKPSLLAWTIANDLSQRQGQTIILTPDTGNVIIRNALSIVQTKQWARPNGTTFGPYAHSWDRNDKQELNDVLAQIKLPDTASFADYRTHISQFAGLIPSANIINRMDRLRRTIGQINFSALQVTKFIQDALLNRVRFGYRQQSSTLSMTIHRAKNREFPNVILLWPHTVTGNEDHLRRLLYNGITRAQLHCTVIVLGMERLNAPPFAQ